MTSPASPSKQSKEQTRQTTFDIPVTDSPAAIDRVLHAHDGILRCAPAWVPRAFCTPGRRLRLHPDDYYPFAKGRGGIDERWIASSIRADNGPETGPYEGLTLVVDQGDGQASDTALVPFDQIIAYGGAAVIGDRLWAAFGAWTTYSKFFDNYLPLPFHVHASDDKAALVGKAGKPEAYYYPPQMNNFLAEQPISFLGLRPGVTREQVAEYLSRHHEGGDNRITDISYGYRTQLGQGWDVPAGVLHAPASVCTYEPQAASDVLSMFESWSNNMEVPADLLWKDVPQDHHGDLDFLVGLLDWETNTDVNFRHNRALIPYETAASQEAGGSDWIEKWIVFKSPHFSAKELTVNPGCSVTLTEQDAYGAIAVQGHGSIGVAGSSTSQELAAITMVRINELTRDEYFVTAQAAQRGVTITNNSDAEPLVVLKNYGPGNVELGL